ncbi:bifunctional methionine sulfoxide reductase B/A protein [Ferrimonas sediminicola]|uniref:Peptide methionine sulfoxide reductase MsrA n=1 Tax=Ferrimonas sediminicola TaxID=2569538 RepID=A0A4U1BBT8_9GAMM|nr:bifunctional methionine sulfoxide reductase B/A protein [Ferrimonas sediminicola]TKB48274.1 bifunctional methionine sulfoxide reductase B/A protein [Ferrimonas sediminicola]
MTKRPLTQDEQRVLHHKGTEAPFSGRFLSHGSEGHYLCRNCGARLYHSRGKFESGCGWPAFDAPVPGAVAEQTDADGRRTEILCRACGGHLGHVFRGERLTPANERHCVNSLSLAFAPDAETGRDTLTLGGGCFWCIEAVFRRVRGVHSVQSGYAGGETDNPSYPAVCSGTTGHAEVVRIGYDPAEVDLDSLLELFFAAHDPTTLNRQGADVGTQYRSIILCRDGRQRQQVEAYLARLRASGLFTSPIVTEVADDAPFYPAEEGHQQYYEHHGGQPYCQMVISPKVASIYQRFADRLEEE